MRRSRSDGRGCSVFYLANETISVHSRLSLVCLLLFNINSIMAIQPSPSFPYSVPHSPIQAMISSGAPCANDTLCPWYYRDMSDEHPIDQRTPWNQGRNEPMKISECYECSVCNQSGRCSPVSSCMSESGEWIYLQAMQIQGLKNQLNLLKNKNT